ncbi:MAG: thermonuclease family protein [Alphaproteobacteria bacterium]
MAKPEQAVMKPPGLSLLIALAWLVSASPAEAAPRPRPEIVASGVAIEIVDGDTLVLESGAQVRLVGIQAPKLPLGRRGFRTWPLAEQAKQALSRMTLGRTLALTYVGQRMDRHGRLLAHLNDVAGGWIQGALLTAGMARVYTFADNRKRAAEMLALEQDARAARRGIWDHRFYRVLDQAESADHADSFQLVEGRVLNTAVVRRRGYLNFGTDWRSDFTISISPRAMRRFKSAGPGLERYRNMRVRVRGWLKSYNGPMIEATHPEQIEILGK